MKTGSIWSVLIIFEDMEFSSEIVDSKIEILNRKDIPFLIVAAR